MTTMRGSSDSAKRRNRPHSSVRRIKTTESTTSSGSFFLDKVLYRSRNNLSVLMLTLVCLACIGVSWDSVDTTSNIKRGLYVMIYVFCVIGTLQLKDGVFVRPHPVVWKVILSLTTLYLLALVFLLFQDVIDVRRWLNLYDSSVGKPLPEKFYNLDCSLTWSNVYEKLDVFIWCHIIGWWIKGIILRDYVLCWILSIMFEVMEYSLQHQLPNFAECWWDHWIMDVLTCNWLGIWLGMKTCEYFEMKFYHWSGKQDSPSTPKGKLNRFLLHFTPESWIRFDWQATKYFKRWIIGTFLIAIILVCELNAFYLKYILLIPINHHINLVRLCFHAAAGAVAVREVYQYVSDPNCVALGLQAWLSLAVVFTESLICFKFSTNMFPNPCPISVIVFWILFVVAYSLITLYFFWPWWPRVQTHLERNATLKSRKYD